MLGRNTKVQAGSAMSNQCSMFCTEAGAGAELVKSEVQATSLFATQAAMMANRCSTNLDRKRVSWCVSQTTSGSFCLNDLAVDFVPERPLLNSVFHIYIYIYMYGILMARRCSIYIECMSAGVSHKPHRYLFCLDDFLLTMSLVLTAQSDCFIHI